MKRKTFRLLCFVMAMVMTVLSVLSVDSKTGFASAATAKVSLAKKNIKLSVGGRQTIKIKKKNIKKIQSVKWKTNKRSVATVSGNKTKATVVAKKAGSAKISCLVKYYPKGKKQKLKKRKLVLNVKVNKESSSDTKPTGVPTVSPSTEPAGTPSVSPSTEPTGTPSGSPSTESTGTPSGSPSAEPTGTPAASPSQTPAGEENKLPSSVSNVTAQANVPMLTLNNGVQMPQLGLGTQIQRLENRNTLDELYETSRQSVVSALQSGYRHLDTAHGYLNERGVGQGIIDSGVPREEIWLTSKLWPSEYGEGVTMEAIDKMLARLQTDYIDLLYLHHPFGDYVGAWKDLEKAYKQGKVRALGISNFDNWPEAFYAIVDGMEIKPAVLQIECHPFAQRKETRELAAKYGIQIECWYPIGHADPQLLQNPVLVEIAAAHEKSVVQVILRWHMQEGFSAIPGSTNPAHIQENIEIFDFELSEEEMEKIRALDSENRYFNIPYSQMSSFFPLISED